MIRSEAEYTEAVQRLGAEQKRLSEHRARLKKIGLTAEQLKRAMDPLKSFHLQLDEEVQSYERLKRGDLGELKNLHGLGCTLIAARIARGITQRELAKRLGVDESLCKFRATNEMIITVSPSNAPAAFLTSWEWTFEVKYTLTFR